MNLDEHSRLIIRISGEGLRRLGGDGGVPLDERSHHSARRLDSERQGSDVEEEKVLHGLRLVAREDGSL